MMNCENKMALSFDIKPKKNELEDNGLMESSPACKSYNETPQWISDFSKKLLKINGLRDPEKLDQMMSEYLEKVLVTNRINHPKTYNELEYIRNLLCFKIWKKTYPKSEKQIITNYLEKYNEPPSNLWNYIQKFRFIPKNIDHSDWHKRLCTIPLQIDDGIWEYFERIEIKNKKHLDIIKSKEKETFISRLFDVLSSTENVGQSFTDNHLLDEIKKETEQICIEGDLNSDDDCIFVDPNAPSPPPPVVEISLDIIDLTNNEPDAENDRQDDLTPTWCTRLLSQVNITGQELLQSLDIADCLPATTCKLIEAQLEKSTCMDYETVNNKLKNCEFVNKCTVYQPVQKLDLEIVKKMSSTDYKTDFPVVNGCKSVDMKIDCGPVNQKPKEFQTDVPMVIDSKTVDMAKDCEPVYKLPNCKSDVNKVYKHINDTVQCKPTSSHSGDSQVNGTTKQYKPADMPELKSATVIKPIECNVNKDFESEYCKTDSQSMHIKTTDKTINSKHDSFDPKDLQLMEYEPIICNTDKSNSINEKSENCNLIKGYSVKETNFESKKDFEKVLNYVIPLIDNEDDCSMVVVPANTTIEDYFNDLENELEICEPITDNINRDITDDVWASMNEIILPDCKIASTSHDVAPVKLQSLSVQDREKMQNPVRNLLHNRDNVPLGTKHPQTSTTGTKILVHESKEVQLDATLNDSDHSFNMSTMSQFFDDESLESRNDSFSGTSSGIPSPIVNPYSCTKHVTNTSNNIYVSTPNIQAKAHDFSKIVLQLLSKSDSISKISAITDNLITNTNNTEMEDQPDADEKSPTVKPMSSKDYPDFLSQINFENNINENAQNDDLVLKINLNVDTFSAITPQLIPIPVEKLRVRVNALPERRVPENGENVIRSDPELWDTFSLTKEEYQLINPQVVVCKKYQRNYSIYNDEVELGLSYGIESRTNSKGSYSLYNNTEKRTILERQDFMKGEKATRVLVHTRSLRSQSVSQRCDEEDTISKQPAATNQTKKRGAKTSTKVAKRRKSSK